MSGARLYAVRVSAFYGALFAFIGIYLPFFPPYLSAQGLSPVEIGVVMGLPLAVKIFATPVVTWLADGPGRAPAVLFACAFGVLQTTLAYSLTGAFVPTAIISAMNAMFLSPLMPLSEGLALRGVRVYALDYGRMRLVGSATFIVGNVGAGLVLGVTGPIFAVWLMAAAAFALLLAGFRLPQVEETGASAYRPAGLIASLRAAANRRNLVVLAGTGLVLASHNQFYVFGTVHWQTQGIGSAVAGPLWAVGVVAEIILFACSGVVRARIGIAGLLAVGMGAALVRWSAMAFDPPLAMLFPLQALHGLTFGASHLAAMAYLGERMSHGSNAVQGLYYTLTGLFAFSLNMMAGPLYESLGGASYAAMAVLSLVGGAVGLFGLTRMRDPS
ncbi:MFS transporter [Tepidamorphus sp. 3E244]|uniref:MFS transporter n=1 Tax=Tepidamorphus sp. 3E244 TaxID=3385498 RepID=UPI0038FD36E1